MYIILFSHMDIKSKQKIRIVKLFRYSNFFNLSKYLIFLNVTAQLNESFKYNYKKIITYEIFNISCQYSTLYPEDIPNCPILIKRSHG